MNTLEITSTDGRTTGVLQACFTVVSCYLQNTKVNTDGVAGCMNVGGNLGWPADLDEQVGPFALTSEQCVAACRADEACVVTGYIYAANGCSTDLAAPIACRLSGAQVYTQDRCSMYSVWAHVTRRAFAIDGLPTPTAFSCAPSPPDSSALQ